MEKKEKIRKFRLSEKDDLLLRYQAERANMDVSEYLRLMIDTSIRPLKDKIRNKEISYEDIKTFLNDKLQFRELFKK